MQSYNLPSSRPSWGGAFVQGRLGRRVDNEKSRIRVRMKTLGPVREPCISRLSARCGPPSFILLSPMIDLFLSNAYLFLKQYFGGVQNLISICSRLPSFSIKTEVMIMNVDFIRSVPILLNSQKLKPSIDQSFRTIYLIGVNQNLFLSTPDLC